MRIVHQISAQIWDTCSYVIISNIFLLVVLKGEGKRDKTGIEGTILINGLWCFVCFLFVCVFFPLQSQRKATWLVNPHAINCASMGYSLLKNVCKVRDSLRVRRNCENMNEFNTLIIGFSVYIIACDYLLCLYMGLDWWNTLISPLDSAKLIAGVRWPRERKWAQSIVTDNHMVIKT